MTSQKVIHWFRQDLRLRDNPALCEAARAGAVLPVYILDDDGADDYAMGAASRVWLHHALRDIRRATGGALAVYRGSPLDVLARLCKAHNIRQVYWNRCYEPRRIGQDTQIKQWLRERGGDGHSFNGSLLWEPWTLQTGGGAPYQVFTPFYKKALSDTPPRAPLAAPRNIRFCADDGGGDDSTDSAADNAIDNLALLPQTPRWDEKITARWQIGERAAMRRLNDFLAGDVADYKRGRDLPAKSYVSRLSPYLHFGQISPHQIWHIARQHIGLSEQGGESGEPGGQGKSGEHSGQIEHFLRELVWREFSYNLLYHFPALPYDNLRDKFNAFPWRDNPAALRAWQRGQTGVPLIDAGMRELWQTGYMHNRLRMLVGSFLVKNLMLHWRRGAQWFWDCLVDADLANNSAGWQWIAGCGADAAPYFRIFNPVTQGHKFDASGEYVRRYVPELKHLPDKHLFSPWEAPAEVLTAAGVTLGKTYPRPIADLKESRAAALAAYHTL